ncbi:MAG: hypothetical protein MUP63_00505 [Candidatus Nanohaloarchaeota archaeon QJJ-7]|nr:hypothetical protein [Candidatus Nanohaloarchaeota archaeon QJJ-7]
MPVEAAVVTYKARLERFESRSERNKFYRGLHGYRRKVRRNDKVYEYEKPGLLGETEHIKVADSAFIIEREHLEKFRNYFDEWSGKVESRIYLITLDDNEMIEDGC